MIAWELQPPVFTGDWGQLEVPQVFAHGGHWYCLFCTAAEHLSAAQAAAGTPAVTGTHYLIGEGQRGPWRVAPGFLDGAVPCRRNAARIDETDSGLVILGFADGGKENFGGYVMDPEPVVADAQGYLSVAGSKQAAQ